ncbi:MAG: hypothetical protein QM770_21770 [Tepidisphaeraceae bacterium]
MDLTTAPELPQTPRDAQRHALSELIRLATECVSLDAKIEQALADASTAIEKQYKVAASSVTTLSVEKLGEMQSARAQALAAVDAKHLADKQAADTRFKDARTKITADYDSQSARIKQQFQDALWEAESVMDATIEAARRRIRKPRRRPTPTALLSTSNAASRCNCSPSTATSIASTKRSTCPRSSPLRTSSAPARRPSSRC